MIDLDGTPNKARLGANAILGVSLAVAQGRGRRRPACRCTATSAAPTAHVLPVPMMNILNGGAHADNDVDIQEFMIAPDRRRELSPRRCAGAPRSTTRSRRCCKKQGLATGLGDEGGFAPEPPDATRRRSTLIVEAIEKAGYKPGDRHRARARRRRHRVLRRRRQVRLRVDDGKATSAEQMVELLRRAASRSTRSCRSRTACAEDDWDGWKTLTDALGDKVQLVGDDLFVTNPERLAARHRARAPPTPCWSRSTRSARSPRRSTPSRMAHRDGYRCDDQPPLGRDRGHDDRRPRRRDRTAARSRPARRRAPSAWRSTTSCCASRRSWARTGRWESASRARVATADCAGKRRGGR